MGKKRRQPQEPKGSFEDFKEDEVEAETAIPAANGIPEAALGKKLASTEKKTRDKAIVVLSKWLARQKDLNEDDHQKIWKALFYCYWMSDKPEIQEELAEKMSSLVQSFPSEEQALRFLKVFYKTMEREWAGIDRLRLDKFYNLMRCMQREGFRYLGKMEWKSKTIKRFNKILVEGPLNPQKSSSLGIKLHVIDIFLDEVTEVIDEGLTADTWMQLMAPYIELITVVVDRSVFERIYNRVLQTLRGSNWLASSVVGEEEDPFHNKPIRHYNRMFKHTYVPAVPIKKDVNSHFKNPQFAKSVATMLTETIFKVTIDPATWDFSRRKLYDMLEEYKGLCTELGVPFNADPDSLENGEADGEEAVSSNNESKIPETVKSSKTKVKTPKSKASKLKASAAEEEDEENESERGKVEVTKTPTPKSAKKGKMEKSKLSAAIEDIDEQTVTSTKKSKKRRSAEEISAETPQKSEKSAKKAKKTPPQTEVEQESPQKVQRSAKKVKKTPKTKEASMLDPDESHAPEGKRLSLQERRDRRKSLQNLVADTAPTETNLQPVTVSPRKHACTAADFFIADESSIDQPPKKKSKKKKSSEEASQAPASATISSTSKKIAHATEKSPKLSPKKTRSKSKAAKRT